MAMPERFNLPGVHALRVYTLHSAMKPCLALQTKKWKGQAAGSCIRRTEEKFRGNNEEALSMFGNKRGSKSCQAPEISRAPSEFLHSHKVIPITWLRTSEALFFTAVAMLCCRRELQHCYTQIPKAESCNLYQVERLLHSRRHGRILWSCKVCLTAAVTPCIGILKTQSIIIVTGRRKISVFVLSLHILQTPGHAGTMYDGI